MASLFNSRTKRRVAVDDQKPEYNAVDASLWYVVAVHELEKTAARAGRPLKDTERASLRATVTEILENYSNGARHAIHVDPEDGLLFAGAPDLQLTWMDASVNGTAVTPRRGKAVEVQALWINALRVGATIDERWRPLLERAIASFVPRFWNTDGGYLFDVIDENEVSGARDDRFRPNQILAVGGLPVPLVHGERARLIVEAVEKRLLTPLGLRTLARKEPGYQARYQGNVLERDGAYHQGAAWLWLLGPFVEAWVRVHGNTAEIRAEARRRFLGPLLAHLNEAGLGHLSELADGDFPQTPRGCPFQAWSVAEALRLDLQVLTPRPALSGLHVPPTM